MNITQKFGPALLRPSPTTDPENCTNQSADLAEAASLVICEDITWRLFFFWLPSSGRQHLLECVYFERAFVKSL